MCSYIHSNRDRNDLTYNWRINSGSCLGVVPFVVIPVAATAAQVVATPRDAFTGRRSACDVLKEWATSARRPNGFSNSRFCSSRNSIRCSTKSCCSISNSSSSTSQNNTNNSSGNTWRSSGNSRRSCRKSGSASNSKRCGRRRNMKKVPWHLRRLNRNSRFSCDNGRRDAPRYSLRIILGELYVFEIGAYVSCYVLSLVVR